MGRAVNRSKRPRASISFDARQYELLERLAREKKVSVAWVVREAVDIYVATHRPSSASERFEPEER